MSSEARQMHDAAPDSENPESGVRPVAKKEESSSAEKPNNEKLEDSLSKLDMEKMSMEAGNNAGDKFMADAEEYGKLIDMVAAKEKEIASAQAKFPPGTDAGLRGELQKLLDKQEFMRDKYRDDGAVFHADAESLHDLRAKISERKKLIREYADRTDLPADEHEKITDRLMSDVVGLERKYDDYASLVRGHYNENAAAKNKKDLKQPLSTGEIDRAIKQFDEGAKESQALTAKQQEELRAFDAELAADFGPDKEAGIRRYKGEQERLNPEEKFEMVTDADIEELSEPEETPMQKGIREYGEKNKRSDIDPTTGENIYDRRVRMLDTKLDAVKKQLKEMGVNADRATEIRSTQGFFGRLVSGFTEKGRLLAEYAKYSEQKADAMLQKRQADNEADPKKQGLMNRANYLNSKRRDGR